MEEPLKAPQIWRIYTRADGTSAMEQVQLDMAPAGAAGTATKLLAGDGGDVVMSTARQFGQPAVSSIRPPARAGTTLPLVARAIDRWIGRTGAGRT